MNKITSYLLTLATVAALASGASSCRENFARPPMVVPTTELEPNVSIIDFKTRYWKDDRNYVVTPGYYNRETGEHIIISGRVVSSGESGNIYNNIVIQDATAAITIAVRVNDMTNSPLYGQEICVDVTGLQVGGYNSLMQLGAEGTYNGAPSMTFMAGATLDEHMGIKGLPNASKVDTATVSLAYLNNVKGSSEGLITWQSRLVKLESVSFEDAGDKFNTSESTISRYVRDSAGNRMILRISNYADFARKVIPSGEGSVTGILSYFGTDWQVLPIDYESFQGFNPVADEPQEPVIPPVDPTGGNGTEAAPFSVAQFISGAASGSDVWAEGYIVGFVPGMTLSDGVLSATGASETNILISDTDAPESLDVCIPVQLPAGSVRSTLNLKAHPENLGKLVQLRGSVEKYFGVTALKSVSEFKLEGGETPEPPTEVEPVNSINENFDASSDIPAGWTQVQLAGNKTWYVPTFNGNNYAAMTGYKGTAPFDQWLITPPINFEALGEKTLTFDTEVNGYGSTTSVFEVYIMDAPNPEAATVKTKLDPAIATAPASGYSEWKASGTLELKGFTGKTLYVAFRYAATQDSNYATWCVDNVIVK